jgi:hypothetical protein
VTKLLAVSAALLALTTSAASGLSETPRLAAIYDAILRARFAEADARIKAACPPAPREACLTLEQVSVWWQIQLDPNSRALDDDLQKTAARAIDAAASWVVREPQRAEAWFYYAGAYAPLSQWRVLRGQRLAAVRNARTIKDALERSIALEATLADAYFGIGLYHYYADVAPAGLKFLRMLLLMPGGDRVRGLREMLQTRDRGLLLSGEADYQLHWLYLWYERQPGLALELLRSLDARYPSNPLFARRIAEVQRDYFHDRNATRAAWQMLLDRAQAGAVEQTVLAEMSARLGLAQALLDGNEPARALETVGAVIDARATSPYGALAVAEFTAARAHEHLGDVNRAISALERAIAHAPSDDPHAIRSRARAALARVRSRER